MKRDRDKVRPWQGSRDKGREVEKETGMHRKRDRRWRQKLSCSKSR
jgi:hypothetical protein